jgi:hypothetical protein
MASTYTGLGTELMTTGENAGDWGSKTNTNLKIIEQLAGGYIEKAITSTPTTLSVSDGATGAELSHRIIKFTGTISANTTVTVPLDVQQMYILMNGSSGNYTVTFKYVSGSGDTVVFKGTDKGTKIVYATADDGTNPNMVDTGIGSHQIHNTLTVGIDDTGYDVKFFGATSGSYALWDESADSLLLTDSTPLKIGDSQDLTLYHDGSNSYITNAVGALKIATETSGIALTIGHTTSETTVADNFTTTGDTSVGGTLGVTGVATFATHVALGDSDILKLGASTDLTLYHDGTNSYITNAVGALKIATETSGIALTIGHTTSETTVADNLSVTGNVTVGVDDTGGDVKLFGASAGAYALWDESANLLDLRGATAAGPGYLKLTTGELTVVDADILGRIDFQAPLESDGSDAILVGASIYAEADATFSATVNNTDIVFATGKTATAAERFRFTADNEIGVAGANYGTDGQVLTSGGAGAAVAWEDASAGAVTQINNATANELVTIASTTTQLDAEANLTFTGSALTCIATITTGVDGTGHDVKFFGDTAGSFLLWDQSDDALELTDSSPLKVGDGGDMTIYHDGTDSFVTNSQGGLKLATETSGIAVTIGHGTSEVTVADNLTITGTTVGTTFDVNGTADAIILDANGNTTISSPTDDQIDFEIAGADDFTMTANTFTILSGSTIAIAAGGAITNAGSMAPDITSTGKAVVFGF